MTNRKLKQQLKRLWEQAPSLSQEKEDYIRQRLMSRIKFEQFNQEPQNFYYLTFKDFLIDLLHPWRIAQSFGAVALSLVLIAVFGIGAVSAQFAKPGGVFYGVKITMERMPLVLPASIMSDQAKAEKEMALAQNRQKEIEAAIKSQSNNQIKSKKIKAATIELSRNIASAQERVEQISQNNADDKIVIAAANSFKDSIGEIKKSLDEVAQKITAADIDSNASDNIKEIMQKASQAELSTLGVLIIMLDKNNTEAPVAEEAVSQVNKVDIDEIDDGRDQIIDDNGSQITDVKTVKEIANPKAEEINSETIAAEVIIKDNPEIITKGGEVKDQIIQDLEQAIKELEKALVPDKEIVAVKEADTAAKTEPVIQKQSENSEVVLNVAEVIEKEMLARQAAKQKALIMELIDDARQSLEAEDLPGALKNIQEARKILEN